MSILNVPGGIGGAPKRKAAGGGRLDEVWKMSCSEGGEEVDNSIISHGCGRTLWTADDIREKIEKTKIVVFAKGNQDTPRCGFTQRALSAMESCGRPYEVVDVKEDSSIIAALRQVAGRKSLPLIYVNGALVSSCDTLQRQVDSGTLAEQVEKAFV